jgi:adenosylcobyric acid synthase
VFENGPWRRRWLNLLRQRRGLAPLSTHAPHHRHQRHSLLERLSAEFTKEINLEPLLRQDL